MKKFILMTLIVLLFSDCEESEPTFTLSFEGGLIVVEDTYINYSLYVALDRPAPQDVTIHLVPSGEAILNIDYTITNPVIIPKGQIDASIDLVFIDDKLDEPDEVGVITIGAVEGVTLAGTPGIGSFTITDDDEADLRVMIYWANGNDQIDMDLYLWHETSPGSNSFELVAKKTNHDPVSGIGWEDLVLSGLDKDGLYGLSYVYRSGNTDNFPFRVTFEAVGSAILDGGKSQIEFNPTYDKKNLNSGTPTLREQYFKKQGFQYSDFTSVLVPESGS